MKNEEMLKWRRAVVIYRSLPTILSVEFPARHHFVVDGRHSVFNSGHSLHQPHHCLPVREVGYAARRTVALGADAGDVGRRIVFRGWCPAAHDVLYPADPLAAVVGEDYHHGPVAPGLVEESHECRVGLQGSLSLPVLPFHAPYVPGVAVAQPAGGSGSSNHTKRMFNVAVLVSHKRKMKKIGKKSAFEVDNPGFPGLLE